VVVSRILEKTNVLLTRENLSLVNALDIMTRQKSIKKRFKDAIV
jgi:hypothetical protein